MSTAVTVRQERNHLVAYALWGAALFGVCGLHRFYAGRWLSGLIWLATGGLCGIGQLIDVVFVSRMVDDHNAGRDVW